MTALDEHRASTPTRDALLRDVLDAVQGLIEPVRHVQRYDTLDAGHVRVRVHVSEHPSLVEQLRAAEIGRTGEGAQSNGYESRPVARLEAIDTLTHIERQCSTWVSRRDALRASLADNLRAVIGVATRLDLDDLADLAREARHWLAWSRVVTGWDTPPWRPNVACPLCEHRGSIRIRLVDHTGVCLHCHAVWEPEHIGLLADHIRYATGAIDADPATPHDDQADDPGPAPEHDQEDTAP